MKKGRNILIAVLLGFIISISVTAYLYFNSVKDRTQNELSQIVHNYTNGAYTLKVKDIDIGFSGVESSGIQLIPSSTYFDTTNTLTHSAHIEISHLKIEIRNLLSLDENNINISSLLIDSISLTLQEYHSTTSPQLLPVTEKSNVNLSEVDLKVEDLNIKHLQFSSYSNKSVLLSSVNQLQIKLQEFNVHKEKNLNISFDKYHLEAQNIKHLIQGDQLFQVENIDASSERNSIEITHVQLKPTHGKLAYWKKRKYQRTYPDLTIDSITIKGLKANEKDQPLTISTLRVHSPKLQLFKNKNIGQVNYKKKELLQKFIYDSPIPLLINEAHIDNGKIFLSTIQKKERKPQVIQLSQLNVHAQNISSSAKDTIDIKGKFKINSTARANIHYQFYNSPQLPFKVEGQISDLSLKTVNTFIPTHIPFRFSKGQIQLIKFNFDGNDIQSNGHTLLKTEGLQLKSISVNNSRKPKFANTLLAIGGNAFHQIKSGGETKFMEGHINYTRKQHKQIFHYSLHNVLNGIIDSYGINNLIHTTEKK